MSDLRTRVSAIVKELYSTIKVLQIHLVGLGQTGFTGTDPQDAETIASDLARIENNKLLELVGSLPEKPEAKAVRDLMGEVQLIDQSLARVEELMLRHAPDPRNLYTSNLSRSSVMSSSTLTDILRTQRATEISVERARASLSDPDLYDAAIALLDLDNIDAILNITSMEGDVKKKGKKEIPTIINLSFCALVLQRTIDRNAHTPGAHDKIVKIMIHVEQLKSQALGPARYRVSHALSQVPLFQQMVQTFHLVPSEPSLPLHQLLQELCPELNKVKPLSVDSPTDLQRELTKLAGSLSTQSGFIVWRKLSDLDHHFRILVDKEYLGKALGEIASGEGVSPKYVTATDTLTNLEVDKKIQKAGDYLITVEGEKFWIIVETLDGANFHCLRPWRGPSPLIPKHWFSGLIPASKGGPVKNVNSDVVPSPRVENYNEILQEEILKHLRAPYVSLQQMTRDESIREDIFWKNLRAMITKKSMIDFKSLGLTKVKPEKFLEQLRKVREDYFGKLVQHIVERIESFDDVKLSADAMLLARRELNLSGVQQLDKLRSSVAKAAEAVYQDMRKVPKNASRNLDLLWPEVLEETLTRFINRRSGVYITLDNKSEVLKTTFSL